MDNQTKVRITIWQPYFAGCMLAFGREDILGVLDTDSELQREIFTWPIEEDIWAGVTDDAQRSALQDRFVNGFQPTLLPTDRSMTKFATFVEDVGSLIGSESISWSTASSGVAEDSQTDVMVNTLLAFHHQLAWLLDVFKDLPGASVSVR